MRAAFTKALYFPSIDIDNSEWLKNAMLFWDEIHTIVPEQSKIAYRNPATQYLESVGFLSPIKVSSDNHIIEETSRKMVEYIHAQSESWHDDDKFWFGSRFGSSWLLHPDKMSNMLQDVLQKYLVKLSEIHADTPYYQWEFKGASVYPPSNLSWAQEQIFKIPEHIASYYMTMLANRICQEKAIALVSDDQYAFGFAESVKFDGNETSKLDKMSKKQTEQGMLLDFIIQGVRLTPDTSLKDILHFKQQHADELGLFRTNLAKLLQRVNFDNNLEAMQQEICDVYTNEFLPAYHNLLKAIGSSRINWLANNLLKVSIISTSSAALPMVAGLTVPQSLILGVGTTLLSSVVQYNVDKKKALRESPYSYLLLAEREWR